ncbi:hypothetical protein M3795_25415 [Ralstonia pickettii]|jgi:hypothetical protein|uniref:hypothetical protein n=1 Tax=Ralstonia TaxID=48736 RepID=UPI00203D8159|nr:hypothetical protein [Ralstonia pickettii]MCL6484338.1 hypothetical protein [Janthinobacterium lividum]MCM3583814.1 hypothetical protein [Ralstonia pickettii]
MKLLAVFSESRETLQIAINQEAVQGRPNVRCLELIERAGKVAIHGADSAVMAVIGRMQQFGHTGLLTVRPLTVQH